MLVGNAPFTAEQDMEIYDKVMKGEVRYPWLMGRQAKDIIGKLLDLEPVFRLGSAEGSLNRGSLEVQEHPFFSSINFVELERKQIKAPYIPNLKDAKDTSNFAEYAAEDPDEANQWEYQVKEKEKEYAAFKQF